MVVVLVVAIVVIFVVDVVVAIIVDPVVVTLSVVMGDPVDARPSVLVDGDPVELDV